MASSHLYSTSANLHQAQGKLPTGGASGSSITNVSTPFKLRSSGSSGVSLQSLPQRQFYVKSLLEKSTEYSFSSSTKIQESPLRIGIIGLGAFGQFLAKAFQRQGHQVLGTSRSDYTDYCQEHNIEFFRDLDGLCEAQPDVILVCSSILSTEDVVRGIPFHKLKPDTVIADVLSVKTFPKNLLLDVVPSGFGILCTHPMFGKFSGKNSWEGLRFVYDKVRVSPNSVQEMKCEKFLDIFQDEGCRMVEMSCEEHDEYAAQSQFVTHTVARILSNMNLQSTEIDTKGYETLVELTRNTVSHGNDLYDGLFLYNQNAPEQIEKLEKAFDTVKKNLFAKLRDSMKRRTEDIEPVEKPTAPARTAQFLPSSVKVLKNLNSFSYLPEEQYLDNLVEQEKELSHAA